MKLLYKIGECPACLQAIEADAEVKVTAKLSLEMRELKPYPKLTTDDVNVSNEVTFTGVVIAHECSKGGESESDYPADV